MRPANLVARGCIVCRAVLDLLAIDLEVHQVIRPIDFLDRPWHLRSVEAVTGYHIHASDGEIGYVEDFLLQDTDWSIHNLVVDTTNWWPGKKVLIAPFKRTERRLFLIDPHFNRGFE